MKLYELTRELEILEELLMGAMDEETGEILESEVLEQLQEEVDEILVKKADNIIKLVRNINADISTIDTEVKRLQAMKKVRKNSLDRLKQYIKFNLEKQGKKKIETSLGNISLRTGRKKLSVAEGAKIPEEFWKVETTLKKSDLEKAVKEGLILQGVQLVEGEKSLVIK